MKKLIDSVKAARAVGTPILAVTTPDQPALIEGLVGSLNGDAPAVSWDRSRGYMPLNERGKRAVADLGLDVDALRATSPNPAAAMELAQKFPAQTIVFAMNLGRFFREEDAGTTTQAVSNLRDPFKGDGRTLIVLGPAVDLPPELRHDVVLLDDPLPDDEQYGSVIKYLWDSVDEQQKAKKKPTEPLTPATIARATTAVRGLSAFEAEQVLAMSMAMVPKPGGIDVEAAWDLKTRAVEKVPGLSMTLTGPALSDLRGLDEVVGTLTALGKGPMAPRLYVRVDEIDKALAGLGSRGGPGDNTGVSQDAHGQFLAAMEDNEWTGAILFGVRGAGKTVLTQSIGAAQGVPTIAMDLGAMKQKHVGESEQNVREAFRMIKSIGGTRVCVLATCNELTVMRPEFLRRFKLGIWYLDLLTSDERDALWGIYLKKYGLDQRSERPEDEGWTGSEIRNCCELAYALGRPVAEIGRSKIVPVTKSDPASIEQMRQQADGRFFSVSHPGVYQRTSNTPATVTPVRRAFSVKGKES